ncbi:MAG: hypothetical protein R2745_23605 [Vicinamibacterales bacterium]
MVYVTNEIRWAIGIWCAISIGLAAGSLTRGASPAWVILLLAFTAAPVVVLVAFTRFRPEAKTSSQVLYEDPVDAEERRKV